MRINSPTIATTTTMTSTSGSVKFWPPTTSAAAILRWEVPNAITLLVSEPGPPRSHPTLKPTTHRPCACGNSFEASLYGKPYGQRQQHEEKERLGDFQWINRNTFEQQG